MKNESKQKHIKEVEPMSKFKVGDRVKVTKSYGYAVEGGLKAGDVTEIIGDRLEMNGRGSQAYYLKSPEQGRYDFSTFKAPDGRWGLFLPSELELVKDEKPKQKHIYIRVDKPIELGDLVRCVENDWPLKVGDIRKVRRLSGTVDGIFFIHGSFIYLDKPRWEVVHKLKVGDLVELHKNGKPMKVTAVYPEDNRFSTPGMMLDWYATDEFRLYQKPVTESIEPIAVDDGVCVGTLSSTIVPDRKAEMQKAVAEMVVELLDREDKENCPQSSVVISNWRDFDKTVTASGNGNKFHTATLSPSDTWDTLTGLFVALSKATGRDLPDWIYGREASPNGIS